MIRLFIICKFTTTYGFPLCHLTKPFFGCFKQADFDGNGMLNCEEFVTMSVHLKKIGSDDELLRQAFRHFDKDESGYIEYEELRDGLSEDILGPNNDQVIQDIIYDVDLDKVMPYYP